ncbi:MAG: hypothetical protein KGZ57_08710 [Dethiobacter sp.]|nr:hypothetical protein [Dethiobacter sp.]
MRNRKNFVVLPGRKRTKTSKKLPMVFLGMTFLFFGLQALYSLSHNFIAARFVRTALAEKGFLQDSKSIHGVFIRAEQVVAAPVTGTLTWLVQGGERLAAGTPVAQLAAGEQLGNTTITSPLPGVVMLALDGLEGALQPQALETVDVVGLLKNPPPKQQFAAGDLIKQGSMLFKVVDNHRSYFLFALLAEEHRSLGLATGQLLRFSFDSGQEVSGKLVMQQTDEDAEKVIMAAELTADIRQPTRFAEAQLIFDKTRGIVVPTSALVQRGEEVGVYTLEQATVSYRPVEVLAAGEETVVVEGLRLGLKVIVNPRLVREGQRL